MKSKLLLVLQTLLLASSVGAQEKLFSVNLFAYGRNLANEWQQESWRETVTIDATDADPSAGFWDTTAWQNVLATSTTTPITADDGTTTATFTRLSSRNGGPWNWTTFRDDSDSTDVGNATLLDGHGNGTNSAGENTDTNLTNDFPALSYRFQVTDIPFPVYDVIVYFGANSGQYLGGGARIRVNGEIPANPTDSTGGTDFVLTSGEPTGTLEEITAAGETGNYIVYKALTGPTFDAQVFGTSSNGFAHIGPAGFQIRENLTVAGAVDADTSTVVALPTAVPADGSTTSTVTVTLKDATGFFVQDKEVSLAGNTGNAVISPAATQLTGADGTASFTVASSTVETEEFTATVVSDSLTITQTASVAFEPLVPDADLSSMAFFPIAAYADGSSTSTITVTVNNENGLPLSGLDVTLAGTPATAGISPVGAQTTDANGRATFSVSSSIVGVVEFTATVESVVITQTSSVNFVEPDAPLNFHVNFYASSGPSANWVPQDAATLEGPASGLGESWNQFNTSTGSNLLAASGVPTGVGYTNDVGSGWLGGSFPLSMLSASRAHFGKGVDTNHKITGLTPGTFFHVYLASYNHTTTVVEQTLGEWSTPNPTTTVGPQLIDYRTQALNNSTWQQGVNYVLFEYVEVDSNGEIVLFGDAADAGDYAGSEAFRLHLNGFQLVQTDAPLARFRTFEVAGAEVVIDDDAKTIELTVPAGSNLATLAPTFTLTSGSCNQPSGAPPSPTFAGATGNTVPYVITDDSTDPVTENTYQVTAKVAPAIGTLVIDLGAGTEIEGGAYIGSGPTNLPLPVLPAGSILRGVQVNVTLEASDNGTTLNYANDLGLLFDPTPGTPGDDFSVGIVSSAANVDFGIGEKLNWAGGDAGVGSSLDENKTNADWTGTIDLGSVGLFLANAYQDSSWQAGEGGTWSGTITLTYEVVGGASAFEVWSGGVPFAEDSNRDGVENGIAFLLGASDPGQNALDRLPTFEEAGGGLVMTFSCLDSASRGPAVPYVEWSSDLGGGDVWTGNAAAVPEESGQVNGVDFQITRNGNLLEVVATIPSTEAANGKLFGRLQGSEN